MKQRHLKEKDKIKDLLGSTIYSRAVSYYEDNRVINSYSEAGKIHAVVRGSGENRYRVEIEFNNDGSLKNALCSCPYPFYCKHIGAVLLKFIEDKEFYPDIRENKVDFNLKRDSKILKKPDDIIPLKDSGEINSHIFRELLPAMLDKTPVSGPEKHRKSRYKLIFTIEKEPFFFLNNEKYSPWILKPALVYIKKDGSPGRLDNYNPSKLTEPITEDEEILLSIITHSKDKSALFDFYVDYFIRTKHYPDKISEDKTLKDEFPKQNLQLFIKDFGSLSKVSFAEIEKTILRFKFYSIRDKEPLFLPVLDFYDQKGNRTGLKPPQDTASVSVPFFVIDKNRSRILYKKSSPAYRNFIDLILSLQRTYNYSEIVQLNNLIKAKIPGLISLEFPIKQIRIKYIQPRPILEIETLYAGTEIKLMFSYKNRIIAPDLKAKSVILRGDKDEIVIAKRNTDYEQRCTAFLYSYLHKAVDQRYGEYPALLGMNITINESIDDFLIKKGEKLLSEGFELRRMGKKLRYASNLIFKADWSTDWLDIKTEFRTENGEVVSFNPGMDVIDGSFLKKGDSYFLLSKSDIEKLKKLHLHGKKEKDYIKVSKYDLSIIDELYKDLINKEDEKLIRIKRIIDGLKGFKGIKKVNVPANFNGRLRKYQQAGLNWLYFLNQYNLNGILADDMGLGKTVQTLALLLVLKEERKLKNALIVAPVSTLSNWIIELKRFTPTLSTYMHHGPFRLKDADSILEADVAVTSYQTLRNDIKTFKKNQFTYLILDEAQIAKNPSSKIYKSVNLVNAAHKLSLTGTPVENSIVDLWSQMNFLNPGILGTLNEYKHKFSKPIEHENDSLKSELLRKIIFPFILRRKKEKVLKELPPKEEIIMYATMENKQRRAYDEIREYYRDKVNKKINTDGVNRSAIIILEALLKLRQAAIYPAMVSDHYSDTPSCKLDLLKIKVMELLSENHKPLIFSQFLGSLAAIKEWVEKLKVAYCYLDGSTRNREKEIRSFQENDAKKLFIISLRAGGLGINLTASDYVIIFDPWWNPAVETQAVDRSHRIGQTNRVTIYKMITKDTVEEKILKLQEKKIRMTNEIITSEKAFFKSLKKDEIMNLFEEG